ncbi:MAG: phosphopyruvate hydratase [Bacteroidales bacterium]|nr:phosphopyruvate hydratase [Bacteroidales bacterium]
MGYIAQIHARQILDSRGIPTIEAEVYTDRGIIARASVPSGSSNGKYEASELRDQDKGRFLGKGVTKAIYNINKAINDELKGQYITNQVAIDMIMNQLDGTDNKSNLGANAILAVSMAVARAGAMTTNQPLYRYLGGVNANMLPIPMLNMISGGVNANNDIDIQDIMILPLTANTFTDAYRVGVEIYFYLQELLQKEGYWLQVSLDGGLAPNLESNEKALDLVVEAIKKSNHKPGEDVAIALDFAASHFYQAENDSYKLKKENRVLNKQEWLKYCIELIKKYPIIAIEDPLSQDDWQTWKALSDALADNILLIGDDLFVTNTERFIQGITNNVANGISIKLNQIGTVTEALNTIQLATNYGYYPVISHRSGETEDTFIAELCIATNSGILRSGAPCRMERVAKYNQILRIEENLGGSSNYHGQFFKYRR